MTDDRGAVVVDADTPRPEGAGRSRPMTVLVYLSHLKLGGASLNAIDLAHAARDLGVRPVLMATPEDLPEGGPSVLDFAEERGLGVRLFEPAPTTWKTAEMLRRVADEIGADVIHTYGPLTARTAYWGPARFGRRPVVTTIFEAAIEPNEFKGIPLVVGSHYLLDERDARLGSVTLVSPPVDLEWDHPQRVEYGDFLMSHGLAPDNMRVVIVSRLVHVDHLVSKSPGIEATMASMETLGRDDVDLVIVGTGPDEARLREIGEGVNSRLGRRAVVFTGPMADPRPAYASADVVVGMGNSAARALAFAKPVVVVGDFGKPATFDAGTAQGLFRMNFWNRETTPDPGAEVGRQLRPLLADGAKRAALGSFGRAFAADNFGLAAMAKRLVGVYEGSLSEYGLRAWMRDLPHDLHRVPAKLARLISRRGEATPGDAAPGITAERRAG